MGVGPRTRLQTGQPFARRQDQWKTSGLASLRPSKRCKTRAGNSHQRTFVQGSSQALPESGKRGQSEEAGGEIPAKEEPIYRSEDGADGQVLYDQKTKLFGSEVQQLSEHRLNGTQRGTVSRAEKSSHLNRLSDLVSSSSALGQNDLKHELSSAFNRENLRSIDHKKTQKYFTRRNKVQNYFKTLMQAQAHAASDHIPPSVFAAQQDRIYHPTNRESHHLKEMRSQQLHAYKQRRDQIHQRARNMRLVQSIDLQDCSKLDKADVNKSTFCDSGLLNNLKGQNVSQLQSPQDRQNPNIRKPDPRDGTPNPRQATNMDPSINASTMMSDLPVATSMHNGEAAMGKLDDSTELGSGKTRPQRHPQVVPDHYYSIGYPSSICQDAGDLNVELQVKSLPSGAGGDPPSANQDYLASLLSSCHQDIKASDKPCPSASINNFVTIVSIQQQSLDMVGEDTADEIVSKQSGKGRDFGHLWKRGANRTCMLPEERQVTVQDVQRAPMRKQVVRKRGSKSAVCSPPNTTAPSQAVRFSNFTELQDRRRPTGLGEKLKLKREIALTDNYNHIRQNFKQQMLQRQQEQKMSMKNSKVVPRAHEKQQWLATQLNDQHAQPRQGKLSERFAEAPKSATASGFKRKVPIDPEQDAWQSPRKHEQPLHPASDILGSRKANQVDHTNRTPNTQKEAIDPPTGDRAAENQAERTPQTPLRGSETFFEIVLRGLIRQRRDVKNDFRVYLDRVEGILARLQEELGGFCKTNDQLSRDSWLREQIRLTDRLIAQSAKERQARLGWVRAYQPDPELVKKPLQAKYDEKLRNAVAKITLISLCCKRRKAKAEFIRAFYRSRYIREVLQNDVQFQRQVEKACPGTKIFLDEVLSEISQYNQRQVVAHEEYESALCRLCHRMKSLLGRQAAIGRNQRTLQTLLEGGPQPDTARASSTAEDDPNDRRPLAAIMKDKEAAARYKPSALQYLIQKFCMTGYPHSIKRKRTGGLTADHNPYQMDILFVAKLAMLKKAITQCVQCEKEDRKDAERAKAMKGPPGKMPPPSKRNIGIKYQSQGANLFENPSRDTDEDLEGARYSSYVTDMGRNADPDGRDSDEPESQGIRAGLGAQSNVKDIDALFNKDVEKIKFYAQVKKRHLVAKEAKADLGTLEAMQKFFDICEAERLAVQPSFITFTNNRLYLVEQSITYQRAAILRKYLELTKRNKEKHVVTLIVDDCQMHDDAFAEIIKGVIGQSLVVKSGLGVSRERGCRCPQNRAGAAKREEQDPCEEPELNPDTTFIRKIIYNNNYLGPKSVEQIAKIIPCLREIQINNPMTGQSLDIPRALVRHMLHGVDGLQQLRLSRVNLNDDVGHYPPEPKKKEDAKDLQPTSPSNNASVDQTRSDIIGDLISLVQCQKQHLQSMDLSYTCLSQKQLVRLSEELKCNPYIIKRLNLSYNPLSFGLQEAQYQESQQFVSNMVEYLKVTDALNHIDLSGMNFQKEQLHELCEHLCGSPNLLAIHLNDNGLQHDDEFMGDILGYFGIQAFDNGTLCRAKAVDAKPAGRAASRKKTLLSSDEVNAAINATTLDLTKKQVDKYNTEELIRAQFGRKIFKDHIFLCKQSRHLQEQKMINKASRHQGIGRSSDGGSDHFVLTRKVNHPELIFNQDTNKDKYASTRFFEIDSAECWVLSQTNECYVCDRHPYTLIFFEKGVLADNADMQEVKDPEVLKKLKAEYKAGGRANKNMWAPQIRGSVVNGDQNVYPYQRLKFGRPLRMVRAEVFATLAISQSILFLKKVQQSKAIKNGLIRVAANDCASLLSEYDILPKMIGWNQVIWDMCFNNRLFGMRVINEPLNLRTIRPTQEMYIYAAFLPPGYHKFLIYDPQAERAFSKSFLVELNEFDFYPEFPKQVNAGRRKRVVQNVWRQWVDDSLQTLHLAFSSDSASENFEPELYIKEPEELERLREALFANFEFVKAFHIQKLAQSEKYPLIDWVAAQSVLEEPKDPNLPQPPKSGTHASPKSGTGSPIRLFSPPAAKAEDGAEAPPEPKFEISKIIRDSLIKAKEAQVQKSQIELCFIRATRHCAAAGLRAAMARSHFLDFLVRVALACYPKVPASRALMEWVQKFLEPVHANGRLLGDRRAIRENKQVNQLLYDNRAGLKQIYLEWRDELQGFTIQRAAAMLQCLADQSGAPVPTLEQVKECFVFSLMTVPEESRQHKKYLWLKYVEFLEMICRVAINHVKPPAARGRPALGGAASCEARVVAERVYRLLEILFEQQRYIQLQRAADPKQPANQAAAAEDLYILLYIEEDEENEDDF